MKFHATGKRTDEYEWGSRRKTAEQDGKQKIDKIRGICYTVYHNRKGGGMNGIEKRIRFGIIDNI